MTSRLLAGVLSGPWTVPGELGVDADQPGLVVDVGPGEAERFADPQAGVGEELEQWPLRAGGGEEAGELVAFEDRDALGCPARLLAGFEAGDQLPDDTSSLCAGTASEYVGTNRSGTE